jgi:hypothetical protein
MVVWFPHQFRSLAVYHVKPRPQPPFTAFKVQTTPRAASEVDSSGRPGQWNLTCPWLEGADLSSWIIHSYFHV